MHVKFHQDSIHLRKPRVLSPLRSLRRERSGLSILGLRKWMSLVTVELLSFIAQISRNCSVLSHDTEYIPYGHGETLHVMFCEDFVS